MFLLEVVKSRIKLVSWGKNDEKDREIGVGEVGSVQMKDWEGQAVINVPLITVRQQWSKGEYILLGTDSCHNCVSDSN